MINTKDNIWIEGFDTYQQFISSKLLDEYDIIYMGKPSEIPEELAKECVELLQANEVQIVGYKNFNGKLPYRWWTAKESIQSALIKEDSTIYHYCIIYKKIKNENS